MKCDKFVAQGIAYIFNDLTTSSQIVEKITQSGHRVQKPNPKVWGWGQGPTKAYPKEFQPPKQGSLTEWEASVQ
jgi:hypothetical protein